MNSAGIKIGIGIPKYRNFHDSLISFASVLSQNKETTEIGISDNNAVPEQYLLHNIANHPNCIYSTNEYNVGALKNFILAYNMVSTRYFTWLGDDDCLSPGFTDTIIDSIKNSKKGVVAWAGIPTSFTSHTALNKIGKFSPNINGSPFERLKKCSIFGKYNFPFYSVFDRNIVSIKPLAKIVDLWPAPLDGIDWAWSYYICLLGEIETIQSQLYLYCMDNWTANSKVDLSLQYRKYIDWCGSSLSDQLEQDKNKELILLMHVNRFLTSFLLIIVGLDELFSKKNDNHQSMYSLLLLKDIFWWLYLKLVYPQESNAHRVLDKLIDSRCSLQTALREMARYLDSRCSFNPSIATALDTIISNLECDIIINALEYKTSFSGTSAILRATAGKASIYYIKAKTLISQPLRLNIF